MARKFSSPRNEEDEPEVNNLTNFPNNSETISNPPRTPQRRSSPESPTSLTEPPGDQCKSFLTATNYSGGQCHRFFTLFTTLDSKLW